MDTDWVPDPLIDYSLQIFEDYNVKCTVFCTHKYEELIKINKKNFEIGIHPNFDNSLLSGKGSSAKIIINNLLDIYPDSKGVRSHSMTQSSKILNLFKQSGILYDSNQFFPYNWNVKPYKCWTGLTRIPYNWEDDIHFTYGRKFNEQIQISRENFYVFDFHPFHIFLNTHSLSHYLEAKKYYQDYSKLKNFSNHDKIGTRDFLIKLLEKVKKEKIDTGLLSEIK
jgi:hypothetical protein